MNPSNKNQEIEILRAVAVIAVIILHVDGSLVTWSSRVMSTITHYFEGSVGVDLFFVISGYVIARSFLVSLQNAQSNDQRSSIVLAFWVRRIFRILPLAWFWLAMILLGTVLLNQSGAFGSFQSNWAGSIAAIAQVANFRFQACFGSFPCGPTGVYWSLSLEEQFYIVLPILALLFRKYFTVFLLIVLTVKLASTDLSYYFAFRFEGLVLGVLLAIWSRMPSYRIFEPSALARSTPARYGLFILAMVILFSLRAGVIDGIHFALAYKLVAIVSALMVWLASYDCNYLVPASPWRNLVLWFGSRSYALYLVHLPAFALTREIWFRFTGSEVPVKPQALLFFALAACLVLLFAEFSYRVIETPLRKRGSAVSKRVLARGTRTTPPPASPPKQPSAHGKETATIHPNP